MTSQKRDWTKTCTDQQKHVQQESPASWNAEHPEPHIIPTKNRDTDQHLDANPSVK